MWSSGHRRWPDRAPWREGRAKRAAQRSAALHSRAEAPIKQKKENHNKMKEFLRAGLALLVCIYWAWGLSSCTSSTTTEGELVLDSNGQILRAYRSFSSEPGNFRISLPAELKPKHKNILAKSPEGHEIALSIDVAETDSFAYMLTYADYPEGYIKGRDSFMQAIKAQILAEFGLRLLDEAPLDLGHLPGLEFRAQGDKRLAQCRLVLHERRLYQLLFMANSPEVFANPEPIDQFFGSFALLQMPEPPAPPQDSAGLDSLEQN